MTSTVDPLMSWESDPMGMARLITDNPPACPPWCTVAEHKLNMLNDATAQWLHWVHRSDTIGSEGKSLGASIRRTDFLADGVPEEPLVDVMVDGSLIIDLTISEAEHLATTLAKAVETAKQS